MSPLLQSALPLDKTISIIVSEAIITFELFFWLCIIAWLLQIVDFLFQDWIVPEFDDSMQFIHRLLALLGK